MPKKTYVVRKKRRASRSATRERGKVQKAGKESPEKDPLNNGADPLNSGAQEPKTTRLVWSLIDFETCRPVVSDAGELKLGETAHHAIDVEGCLGGVFEFKDAMGIVGTLVAFPGMHPEAFVQKFDRGDADEFTYIVKDGVKEFASVIKEGEA